jgi:CRISPR-associated protein Csx14
MMNGAKTMAEASIPVDILNPGQVFACLGFAEAANILLGDAEGAFDWSDPSDTRFFVRGSGNTSPVESVLEFLAGSSTRAVLPECSAAADWKSAWGELITSPVGDGYPFPVPASPATAVCELLNGARSIMVDYWGDTERDNVKFWAGAAGYPGAALARDALELTRSHLLSNSSNPFALALPQSSSFRFDWRRDYIPIDIGFSLNAHGGQIETVGFPIVELLAAIGVTNSRPRRVQPRNKLEYLYGVLGRDSRNQWFPLPFLRAALGAAEFPFAMRRFHMFLSWPGKEGQARAITRVEEMNQ